MTSKGRIESFVRSTPVLELFASPRQVICIYGTTGAGKRLRTDHELSNPKAS